MWVIKRPKPGDFCGCPPCPICFDFVEPRPAYLPQFAAVEVLEEVEVPEPVVIPGLEKMARDLLGREPNDEERKIIQEAGDRVHLNNKNAKIERDKLIAQRAEEKEDEHFLKKLHVKIKGILEERNAPKPLNTRTIDDMDPEKVKELCGSTPPVDQELVNRERDSVAAAKKAYEQMAAKNRRF